MGFALLICMSCLYSLISVQSTLHSDIVCQDFLRLVCYRPFWCCLSSYYKKGSDCDRWHRTHPWGLNKSSALACKFISVCGSTEIICIQISYINSYVLTSTGQLQGFILFSKILTLALWLNRSIVHEHCNRPQGPFLVPPSNYVVFKFQWKEMEFITLSADSFLNEWWLPCLHYCLLIFINI